ncbi:ATP-binding protein [Streptomyces sudanensis]|uniref:ATP-binding protein n=1 Tax=Streptomyces sudanensis TaxID=436397 RepID=UPI0020CBC83D|nr:ATP-binding protein [Streptomyces sudanensis]MCP9957592.1 ATP-binding protein [Streptomyces sudanensis]MCQ0001865.1 ATP-binding protein [Streptomyces sudanensis]
MKNSAAKALGVSVLGAALAVSAAGSASALTDVPVGKALEAAAESVPVAQTASGLSDDAGRTAALTRGALPEAAPAAPAASPLDPVTQLLGGLPLGGLLPDLG